MPASTCLGAVGELAASRHGAVTRRQAAELGLQRNAVARLIGRGVLHEPVPGVLCIAGAPPTWAREVYIATLEGGDERVAIAATAAHLHGADGFTDDSTIRVAGRRGARARAPDTRLSQTLDDYDLEHDVTTVDGIRCATHARALCDIAREHPERYERAADDYQRRGLSLLWLEQTAARVKARGPWRRLVADDLARRRRGGRVADSWFERLVEECLRSRKLPPLERQFVVRTGAGEFVARVDLAIPSLRLAIEAHSRQFHFGPGREAFDERRDNAMAVEGWHTSFVGWADATSTPAQVRRTIERMAARRAIDLGLDLRALVNAQRPASGR